MNKRSFLFIFIFTTAFMFYNSYMLQKRTSEAELEKDVAVEQVKSTNKESSVKKINETFYVLENSRQQVVFSTLGGAIAEINLNVTEEGKKHGKIEPVAIDQEVSKKSPNNAYFPNKPYHIVNQQGKDVIEQPKFGGHTPLLRRSLKDQEGNLTHQINPKYYATTLLDETASEDVKNYEVEKFTKNSIELVSKDSNRTIRKIYRLLEESPFSIELEVKVDGDTSGLWLSSGVTEVDLINGMYTPILQYLNKDGKKGKVKKVSLPKTITSYDSLRPSWSGISNGYFGLIVDPLTIQTMGLKAEKIDGEITASRLCMIDPESSSYPASKFPGYEFLLPYKATTQTVKYMLYAGPFDKKVLSAVDTSMSQNGSSDQLADAMSYSSWMSSITAPISKFLSIFLNWFYTMTHSWGFSIILLTLMLRIVLYPMNHWAFKSQKKLQEIGPKQKALNDKYKSDPKRLQMELAMLYRNEKVNPFSSCLPTILQFPFLIGMYQLLQSNYSLRGASFIPGWIDNLSAPDVLFSWGTPIMFFGTGFHLLPFILGGLTFIQGKINTWMQKEKVELTDQQKQMNSMATILPIVMIFIFYNMASGLNIYWIFSSLFGIIQQYVVLKAVAKGKKTKRAR